MDSEAILSLNELRKTRTVPEFLSWVDDVLTAFAQTRATKDCFRLGSGTAKIFREEILPFRRFVDSVLHETDAIISFPADSENRDVIVTYLSSCRKHLVEIVSAVDGYENRLRMELLTRKRSAPGMGPIKKVGANKKAGYDIEAEPEAKFDNEIVANVSSLVTRAIKRKLRNNYPVETWLVVVFEDLVFSNRDNYNVVKIAARNCVGTGQFGRVYLLGTSNQKYVEQIWPPGSGDPPACRMAARRDADRDEGQGRT